MTCRQQGRWAGFQVDKKRNKHIHKRKGRQSKKQIDRKRGRKTWTGRQADRLTGGQINW